MSLQRNEVLNIATQAAEWLRIMRTSDLRDDEAFLKWLKRSPLHVRELLLAYRLDQKLTQLDAEHRIDIDELIAGLSSNVLAMNPRSTLPSSPALPRPRRARWIAGLAASAAAIGIAAVIPQFVKDRDESYATNVGEQRNFELEDGSVVWLNTHSRIRVSMDNDARRIDLEYGQALFDVAHDATRPFRVYVDTSVIQAVGTQFDVNRDGEQVAVSVVEGTVQIMRSDSIGQFALAPEPKIALPRITAGEGATVTSEGQVSKIANIDAEAAIAWRQQQLVFEDTPLTQIVSEFNRYNRTPQLRVEDIEVGALKFNGVFGARNPESLLTYLSNSSLVAYERRGDEVIIRASPAAKVQADQVP